MTPDQFQQQVTDFALEIQVLLDSCLPGETLFENRGIATDSLRAAFTASKSLHIGKSPNDRVSISFEYKLCVSSTSDDIAVEQSSFKINYCPDKKPVPIVRFEYERKARTKPVQHFQFHADSVPLGLVLARGGQYGRAAQQQNVHFPMGGHRFRVIVEDIIEFCVRELNAKPLPGWEEHVQAGRRKYRSKQVGAVVRKNLIESVKTLRQQGFTVIPPEDFSEIDDSSSNQW